MMRYGGLSVEAAQALRHFNRVRNAIQHENEVCQGSCQAVEQYARLMESIIMGPEHTLAAAAYTDDLFAATLVALDRPASPKLQAPPGGAPSAARPLPTDAPARPPAAAAPRPVVPSSRGTSPVRDARPVGRRWRHDATGGRARCVLAVLLYATLPREPAQPAQSPAEQC